MIDGPDIMSQTTQNDRNKDMLQNGNEIIKTANHFVGILGDGDQKKL